MTQDSSTPAAPTPPSRDMRGYIARNATRSGSQPNWRGKVNINGKEFLLSLWEKEGNPDLMNLSVTDPENMPSRTHPATGAPHAAHPSAAPAETPAVAPDGSPSVGVPQNDFFGDIFGPTA